MRPGAKPGSPARVTVFPLEGAVEIVNRARTGGQTRLDVRLATPPDHRGRILVKGTIATGAPPHREWIHLGDPARALLGGLEDLLAASGIVVEGSLLVGRVPDGATVLARRTSPPLASLVRAVNKYSSNFGAEILLRHLGASTPPGVRSTPAGLEAVRRCLDRWGIGRRGLVLADGSGFAPANRLTVRALAGVVGAALQHPDWGPELIVSLPRAGEDGSLRRRLPSLRGRVRAKTGSLSRVTSLAGLLTARDGRAVPFAAIVNASRGTVPRGAADALVRALVRDLDARLAAARDPARD